jgi:4-amino-4-deoxy-L-arabinose transferase-like glycosyltransferase
MGIILAAWGRPWAGWALTVAGLGLGALTKGPVILILALPVALLAPLWRPAPGPWWRWYASLLLAVAGGAVIALAWAVPAAIHGGPDYAHAIFWGQSADRMVDSFAHRRPLWWYLPLLLAMLFPWSLWPKAWRALWMLRRDHDWGVRFLWCWILSGVLIFSLVSGKQMHYLLPFLPGFALLLARGLDARSGESPWRWPSRALVAIIPLALAMASAWLRISPLSRLPGWAASLPLWLPLALLGIAAILWLPYRRLATEAAILGSGTIALVAVLIIGIMQPARPWYDLTPAAAIIADAQAHGHAIAHIGKSHNRFRYPGQLIRPISDINAASLQDWGCQHPGGLVILYDNDNSAGLQALHTQALRGKWLRIVRISDLGLPPCSPADVRIGAPAAVSGKSPN